MKKLSPQEKTVKYLEQSIERSVKHLAELKAIKAKRLLPAAWGSAPSGDGSNLTDRILETEKSIKTTRAQLERARKYKPADQVQELQKTIKQIEKNQRQRPSTRDTLILANHQARLEKLQGERRN